MKEITFLKPQVRLLGYLRIQMKGLKSISKQEDVKLMWLSFNIELYFVFAKISPHKSLNFIRTPVNP